MKNKNYHVEFWRIIATALIVRHHTYYIGINQSYRLYMSWIYVEFFYILTGFFTAAHFDNHKSEACLNDKAKESIKYTFLKFFKFAPFFIPAMCIEYILRYYLIADKTPTALFNHFGRFPLEAMLLSSSQGSAVLGPVWFLSAMFIVFPLLSFLLASVPSYVLCIFGSLYSILYYGITGVTGKRTVPHDILRAFAALLIGVIIYYTVKLVKSRRRNDVLLLILGDVCMLFTVWMCYLNAKGMLRAVLIAFAGGLVLLLSSESRYPDKLKHITDMVSKYCMPMVIYQRVAATSVNVFFSHYSNRERMYLYYLLCIVYAFISFQLVSLIQRRKKLQNKSILK